MKFWKVLRKKPFCNDFHFLLISCLLFLLSFKYWPFYILLGLYFIFLFKKTKIIIPCFVLILTLLIEIVCINLLHRVEIEDEIQAYVYDVKEDSYTIIYKGIKIQVSEYNHNNKPGDMIHLKIELNEKTEKSYDTDFDYQEYLYSKGIAYSSKGKTIHKVNEFFSISSLKYYYLSYLKENLDPVSYSYVSAMVFAENNLEDNVKDCYSILGLSHILAISGLHILFLFKVISFLLLKIFKYYKKKIPIIILVIYSIIIGAPPSALRALLFVLIGVWNKKGDISYTRLDILSISCILMLLMNPYQMYSTGFLLTYLVSFVLIFIKPKDNKLKGLYKSYLLIYFSTFPIVINMTNKISLISFLLSPIFSIFLSSILLPISYILSVIPILDIILKYVYIFINSYLEGITSYNVSIAVPSFNIWAIAIYYILFIFMIIMMEKNRRIILPLSFLSLYLVSIINLRYLNPFYEVTFIDCGQGDSSLIRLPYGKGVMLIDAYNSYDYLKSLGLDSIDIIVFTHSDSDHIGDYKEIIDKMKVKKIYVPIYDLRFDELFKNIPIIKIKTDDVIYLDNLKINVLGPIISYDDSNSNSIVLSFEIENVKYMFTGDMTEKEENDLVLKYGKLLDSDILKVAHHGSDTSSRKSFIDLVTPNISIISVAKKNNYNLPSISIVSRLKEYSIVYKTYERGNINIYQALGKVHISTYR